MITRLKSRLILAIFALLAVSFPHAQAQEKPVRVLTALPVVQSEPQTDSTPPKLQINENSGRTSLRAQSPAGATATSLSEAMALAYQHNPTLLAARAGMKATHERLPQAFAGWKPTVGMDLDLTKTDTTGSNFGEADGSISKDANVSFNQPIYRGGRTSAQISAARYAIRAQREILRQTEQRVFLDVATAYMDTLKNQALVDLSQNNRDIIARQLEATTDRFDVGELTRTDVSQAQARLSRADSDLIRATGDLNAAKARFEQVVGHKPGVLKQPDIAIALPENLDEAQAAAEELNPLVLSSSFSYQSAEEDVDEVFGELLPEVGFVGSWNRTKDPQPGLIDEQTTKSVSLSASIPLYDAGGVRSRVRQAKHTANQRYMEIIEARRQVRQEAATNWESWQTALAEIESRNAQAEASAIAREGVNEETALGMRAILDALDAEQELLDAQVALIAAQRDEVVARFSMLSTLGKLKPEIFGFDDDGEILDEHLKDIQWKIFGMDVDSVGDSP
jgi:TolC family type I secretion outer membrane protein